MDLAQRPTLADLTTLVDLLRWRATHQADQLAYTFLRHGEDEEDRLTYGELDRKARAIAAHLQQMNQPGGRALLLYPSGLDYVAAFFGCLYAGVIAVPAYPPRRNRSLDRIEAIVSDAEAFVTLTTDQIQTMTERRFKEDPKLRDLDWFSTDHLDLTAADEWTPPAIDGETLAFLQYTSGSTGTPKGVMVSHRNLLQNEQMITEAFGHTPAASVVGWLPLYHDMGLIGNVINPLYVGYPCVLMAPVDFLQKPVRWLQAISKYKATTSGGPNFAYELCVEKITDEQMAGLDLSHWTVAFNGAEPIRAATLERFAERFAPYGFDAKAMYPCYGLAEATLFVSGNPKEEAVVVDQADEATAEGAQALVGCGQTWREQHIKIVEPDTMKLLGDEAVGEIWISGPNVAQGYWNRPDATEQTFQARAVGNGQTPSLRTGDLGFLKDGQLYVTGRLKDLIIIRGRNHYPQDIEQTVADSHDMLRTDAGAAFSVTVDGEEKLVVVNEVERMAIRQMDTLQDEIVSAVRQAVSSTHELQVYAVVLLKTGSVPKTSSGKIQRHACRTGYLNGTLSIVGEHTMVEEAYDVEDDASVLDREALLALPAADRRPVLTYQLQGLVAKALKLSPRRVDVQQPLGALGLDSLDVVELKLEIETELEVTIPMDDDLSDLTTAQLAAKVVTQLSPEIGDGAVREAEAVDPASLDLFAKVDTDGGYFGKYRLAKDQFYTQPVLEGDPGPRMRFQGREVLVWSVNNYLGLCGDDRLRAAVHQTVDEVGTWAPMGSRMLTGNTHRHQELERRLAAYLDKESSIVFNFGYMGVMGTIASLVSGNDTVIIDSLSHACIVDGAVVAAAGKPFRVFRHNDLNSLEDQLKAANKRRKGGVMVVTEGVFGMSGDTAPLPEICRLKDEYGARLFVDDAHGFGIMGETGAGTGEFLGCQDQIDLYFGTFAKSFAAIGGVTAGDEKVIDYIRYNARPYIFAKSLPMVYVEHLMTALDIIKDEGERRDQVWHIAHSLRKGLNAMGYNTGHTQSPITPVYVPAGDESTATDAMRILREEYGIFVSAVTYPVVPKGIVLFRLTSTAAHTDADVAQTLEAFQALRDRLNLQADNIMTENEVGGELLR